MIELSIPQKGEETRNVKDLVFTILTEEHPLSIIEITNKIQKIYNISTTYQGVRKAVDKLHEQNVLIKKGKKYELNKSWVLQLRSFFDKILTNYDKGSIYNFKRDLAKENYAVYTFYSLWELDKFWADILMYLVNNLEKDEPKFSMNYGHYTWWMLINLASEINYIDFYKKKKVDTYFLWLRDLPLNMWSAKIYKAQGHKCIVKEIPEIDETIAVNTVGDTIIQVKYSKDIVKKVKSFFEKYSSVQDMSMKEITEIAHSKCEIKFIVFKNKPMAENLNKTYMKYF
jgi:hypothetical protein